MEYEQSETMQQALIRDEEARRRDARREAYAQEIRKYQGPYRSLAVSGVLPPRLLFIVQRGGWDK